MSVPTSDPNKRKPGFFQIPLVNAPASFFNFIQSPKTNSQQKELRERVLQLLYPKQIRLEKGQILIPQQYIVVGDINKDYSFLVEGQPYTLKKGGDDIATVNVSKNRRCSQTARALILLESIDFSSLEFLATIAQELDVTSTQVGSNILGTVVTGRTNAPGSGEGYPNAYGHTRPELPASFLPLFNAISPVPPVELPPGALPPKPVSPGRRSYTFLEWLLLVFYQFLAWLLSAFKSERPVPSQSPVKVAILDTGLGSTASQAPAQAGDCGDTHTGWNFVDNSPNVGDDHHSHHGSRITAIIRQQAPSAICLPVKTSYGSGVCELYDVLCGLEYARVNKANIVNASFCFSATDDPAQAIPILHTMISSLEQENIWVIAAAGNAVQYTQRADGTTPPLGEGGPFLYPACYSQASNRIITVTTVSKSHQASPAGDVTTFGLGECYSSTFVDVGIIANGQPSATLFKDDKDFKAPGFDPEPGTSYATAYMSGRVANVLATQPLAGKVQMITIIGPELKQELATGIQQGQSVII